MSEQEQMSDEDKFFGVRTKIGGQQEEPVEEAEEQTAQDDFEACLLYTSPSPRDQRGSRMPSSA